MDEPAAAVADPETGSTRSVIVVGAKGRRSVDPQKVSIQPCDFRSPALISESDLRRLRGQQAEFARHFGARVSAFLRLEFSLSLAGVVTMPYAQFTRALPDPAHLTLFKVDPLAGLGIISLPPALGLAVTNRMLGGRGKEAEGADRALTEIETSLLEDFVRMIAEEWCRQWPEPHEARPLLVGYETNGKFLQTSPEGATMLVVTFDALLGERAQPIQIAMPFAALEGSIKGAHGPRPRAARPAATPAPDKTLLIRRAASAGISLPAVADWMVADVPLRDVLHLRAGDVLEMPAETLTRTRLSLTGQPFFVGTAGVRDGRIAVKLDRRLEDAPAGGPAEPGAQFITLLAQ